MIKVKTKSKEHRDHLIEAPRFHRKSGSPTKENRLLRTADYRNHSN